MCCGVCRTLQFWRGLDRVYLREQDGYYPSHWRVNQVCCSKVRQLVGLMEHAGDGYGCACRGESRNFVCMLLVLLRRSSLMEGATNNDGRLNQLVAWLEDHLRRSAGRR